MIPIRKNSVLKPRRTIIGKKSIFLNLPLQIQIKSPENLVGGFLEQKNDRKSQNSPPSHRPSFLRKKTFVIRTKSKEPTRIADQQPPLNSSIITNTPNNGMHNSQIKFGDKITQENFLSIINAIQDMKASKANVEKEDKEYEAETQKSFNIYYPQYNKESVLQSLSKFNKLQLSLKKRSTHMEHD